MIDLIILNKLLFNFFKLLFFKAYTNLLNKNTNSLLFKSIQIIHKNFAAIVHIQKFIIITMFQIAKLKTHLILDN